MGTPQAGLTGAERPARWGRGLWVGVGIALSASWAILRAGVSIPPSFDDMYQAAVLWPRRLDDGFRAYFTDSPLGTLVFRALPWQSRSAFLWLMLLSSAVAIAGLALWVGKLAPQAQRARAARLALLAPITAVLVTWLGGYDGFTILAWLACMYAWAFGRPWVLALAGVLLGFQHFEHGILGLAALWLTWLALGENLPTRLVRFSPLWVLPGLIVGKAALMLALAAQGSASSGRASWLQDFLREWTVTAISVWPTLLWACFAGSWAIIVAYLTDRLSKRTLILLAAAFSVGLVATLLSGDRPRVITLVMAPALAIVTLAFLHREARKPNGSRNLVLVESIVWLAPPVFLWGKVVIGTNVIDQIIVTWSHIRG